MTVNERLRTTPASSQPALQELRARAFPDGTPLNAFFAWNEDRRATDRRYRIARDLYRLRHNCEEIRLAHLAGQPLGLRRSGALLVAPPEAAARARRFVAGATGSPALVAAQQVGAALREAVGSSEIARHAAVFRAFEVLDQYVDLDAVARLRAQPRKDMPSAFRRRRILIVKLGALGDFIQALGPVPDIRRHHRDDHLSLLTTGRYAEVARQTGLFDAVLVDRRPRPFDLPGWLVLRRTLRRGDFDRVYDFQTSDRSNAYFRLLRPGRRIEWSGTASGCSHPHANLARDRQHTMDRQAEQLLMAGIYPVSLMPGLPPAGELPTAIAGRRFVMLIPGSSPGRPAKRWPAERYGELARRLAGAGYTPVVVGIAGEETIAQTIAAACPHAVNLVGRTDVAGLAALAQFAAATIGNDTGATHVAAAGGNPVVALFSRASSPSLCAPRGAGVRVLVEPDLSALPVATVLAAALEMASDAETRS